MFKVKNYKYKEPSNLWSDELLWNSFVAPGVILQKDGILQRTFCLRGPDSGSSSGNELNLISMMFNNAIMRLGSRWAVFYEAQRYKITDYPWINVENEAAYLVERERKQAFQKHGNHFDSSYYLTFVWGPDTAETIAKNLFYNEPSKTKQNILHRVVEKFIQQTNDLIGILNSFFIIYPLDNNETTSYLHSSVSLNWHLIKTPERLAFLDKILADQKLVIGDILKLGSNYIPILTINDFPSSTYPAILDALNQAQIEYRWMSRFICLSKEDSNREVDRYLRYARGKKKDWKNTFGEAFGSNGDDYINPGALSEEQELNQAALDIHNDLVGFGHQTTNLMVWDEDIDIAFEKLSFLKKIIERFGFSCIHEQANSFQAFLSMMPGNVFANVRRHIVSTGNFAHVVPLTAIWSGNKVNEHLGKITGVDLPHLICSTNSGVPFYFNPNMISATGHGFITGPTEAGKSTAIGLFCLAWLKYSTEKCQSRVVIIDKDRSARQLTMAVGGDYYEPGAENFAFQPLGEIEGENEIIWACEFIELLLTLQNVKINPDIRDAIYRALLQLKDCQKNERTISTFIQLVQYVDTDGINSISKALIPYSIDGAYGSIFDSDHDAIKTSFWTMFEMNELMNKGEAAVLPALSYLFHAIEKTFDGSPTLFIIDEAWLFLDHEFFKSKIREFLKTLRKKNVMVIFATQEVADAADSGIVSTILQQTAFTIFLPDKKATTPHMSEIYTKFGLSDMEIHLLSQSRKRQDYYYKCDVGSRLFNLDLGPIALALITDPDHQYLDHLEKNVPKNKHLSMILEKKGFNTAQKTA